ncbi:DUF58 domain-containing protein [Endothiovibrio diazotrophicus]
MKTTAQSNNSRRDGVEVSLAELIALRARAGELRLSPQRQVRSQQAGGYHSPFKGRGIDFEEVRGYQPGDDIRSMDWRVTARTGRPHTKLFREERERPVLLWVDQGPTLRFGSRVAFKSVVAARAAALLAWAAVERGDRVGGLLFGGREHLELRPKARKAGVLPLLNRLSAQADAPLGGGERSDLVAALTRLRRVAHPGSLLLLISDFFEGLEEAAARTHLAELARHNDLVLIFVYDPLEEAAPPPGRYPVGDGLRRLVLDTADRRLADAYRERFAERRDGVRRHARRLGIPFIPLATDAPLVETLRDGLRGGGR